MDIHHDDKTNTTTVIFDLSGRQKEDVSIDVHNSILTVSGETKETTERDEAGFAHRERHWGKWSRSLSLPQGTKVSCSINPSPSSRQLIPFFRTRISRRPWPTAPWKSPSRDPSRKPRLPGLPSREQDKKEDGVVDKKSRKDSCVAFESDVVFCEIICCTII